ncbi:MAG: beta-L-arabinofuranosidase domain-containing protein [Bacteroidota bacterium]
MTNIEHFLFCNNLGKYFKKTLLGLSLTLYLNIGQAQTTPQYPIQPIPFSKVTLSDNFWLPKIKTNHEVTIPIAIEQSQSTGRLDNFRIAAGLKEGKFSSVYPFDDSDVFKIVEAASYSLQVYEDEELEQDLDSLIYIIAASQEEDGYLYTNRTIGENVHEWAGEQRWELVHELSHELYNLGHLYEAAVAHYLSTGKRTLLDVALKSADLVDQVFGPGKMQNVPGHQEIEIGLVKLYLVTQEVRYLNLAKFFLDIRGRAGVGNPKEYDQSHLPVTEQTTAVGHSVRGAYMWTAMADIAAITKDDSYFEAINHIWKDVVGGKYYINGGIGATNHGEAFGNSFELPNMTAYCETCAAVGNSFWNYRMFLMTGEAKYIDVLERSMYNNVISGVSVSGDRFFYPNPLASAGQHERQAWFGCACCPPNVARFLPSMPGYIYAQKKEEIYVNLYISSETDFSMGETNIHLQQTSGFPYDGQVQIAIQTDKATKATIKLRVPGYVQSKPVPSDLYHYKNELSQPIEVYLNKERVELDIDEAGYLSLEKTWTNDVLQINFPLDINVVEARSEVKENEGKIAIERGPLLYCAEAKDNPNGVLSAFVGNTQQFRLDPSETYHDAPLIFGTRKIVAQQLDGSQSISEVQALKLIPYHLWNNRGSGEMSVWLAMDKSRAKPKPAPTIAYTSTVSASKTTKSIRSMVDQEYPDVSNQYKARYYHWWPQNNSTEWVQFDFDQSHEISEIEVFWFDDGPHGGCRIPVDWKVLYQDGEDFIPVESNLI